MSRKQLAVWSYLIICLIYAVLFARMLLVPARSPHDLDQRPLALPLIVAGAHLIYFRREMSAVLLALHQRHWWLRWLLLNMYTPLLLALGGLFFIVFGTLEIFGR